MTDNSSTQLDRDALKTMSAEAIAKATTMGRLDSLLSGQLPPPVVDDSKMQALRERLKSMTPEEITKTTRSGGLDDDLRGLSG